MADRNSSTIFLSLAFGAIGWIVFLSGLGASQSHCNSGGYEMLGTAGYFTPAPCSELFGYSWWILWLEFGVLLMCFYAFMKDLSPWKLSLVGLLAVAAVLVMDTANSFLGFNRATVDGKSQAEATLAGAIMCSMANLILLVAIGQHSDGVVIPNAQLEVPQAPKPAIPHAGNV